MVRYEKNGLKLDYFKNPENFDLGLEKKKQKIAINIMSSCCSRVRNPEFRRNPENFDP